MEKKIIHQEIDYVLEWTYGVSIADIRKDLDELEKLGATGIDIEAYESYGDAYISIKVYSEREETDEEYQQRIKRIEAYQNKKREEELAELKRLKEKYEK